VRRGDRVRRGPSPLKENENGVYTGQLGSVVQIGTDQETVTIKWDRSPADKTHCYTWPDPEGHVLTSAGFQDVSEDVEEIMDSSCLSSAASEECLRRAGYDLKEAKKIATGTWEEDDFREPPKLFHHVRILPDSNLVQDWFDSIPACSCAAPRCRGGLQWSSRADKHLGREAVVLKIDYQDDTVLVETIGICECQIWYPRLAVTPVFNPDLSDKPAFKAKDRVECRMEAGWLPGVVDEVFWNGADRTGPCPYTAALDDGRQVRVPNIRLIRSAQG
jgi:hypothetical protein